MGNIVTALNAISAIYDPHCTSLEAASFNPAGHTTLHSNSNDMPHAQTHVLITGPANQVIDEQPSSSSISDLSSDSNPKPSKDTDMRVQHLVLKNGLKAADTPTSQDSGSSLLTRAADNGAGQQKLSPPIRKLPSRMNLSTLNFGQILTEKDSKTAAAQLPSSSTRRRKEAPFDDDREIITIGDGESNLPHSKHFHVVVAVRSTT